MIGCSLVWVTWWADGGAEVGDSDERRLELGVDVGGPVGGRDRGRRVESLGDEPDAERELPRRDRKRADRRESGDRMVDAEQPDDDRGGQDGRADEAECRKDAGHEAG